jgi:hypothetical protein
MFLARLDRPFVSKIDKRICWDSQLLVINVSTEKEAMEELKSFAPPKEKEIAEALVSRGHKPVKYYIVYLYELPPNQTILSLGNIKNVQFPKEWKEIKF